jgi:oxygen-independent coproporphyrinogen-3 oxidase
VHYQNEPNWEPYLTAVESGRLPIARGLVPTRRDLLLREVVLGLKRGALDTRRLAAKYGIDPLTEWAKQWDSLAAEGVLAAVPPEPTLTRDGLLKVDALLHRFFD